MAIILGRPMEEADRALAGVGLWKRFWIKSLGRAVSLGFEQPPGFTAPTEFFLFWCREHQRPVKTYERGEWRQLRCPDCEKGRQARYDALLREMGIKTGLTIS